MYLNSNFQEIVIWCPDYFLTQPAAVVPYRFKLSLGPFIIYTLFDMKALSIFKLSHYFDFIFLFKLFFFFPQIETLNTILSWTKEECNLGSSFLINWNLKTL